MLAAHSLLAEDRLEEGQQIAEQEYCCSSTGRQAAGADKGKGPSSKAAGRAKNLIHCSHFSLKSREGICKSC